MDCKPLFLIFFSLTCDTQAYGFHLKIGSQDRSYSRDHSGPNIVKTRQVVVTNWQISANGTADTSEAAPILLIKAGIKSYPGLSRVWHCSVCINILRENTALVRCTSYNERCRLRSSLITPKNWHSGYIAPLNNSFSKQSN